MQDRDVYIWIELLGRTDMKVQSLEKALENPKTRESAKAMLRNMVIQEGWNPDDPPKIFLPRDISPSDYIVGTAISGDVLGDDIGPSDSDLDSHIGLFGMTSVGKTTLVKLLLVAFTKGKANG